MRGFLRVSPRCLVSYRDNRRLMDAYHLLVTKKPVEYDYVAIDVDSFISGAQRLAKNVTPESRRNKEVARHVVTALEQLLRRVVCKQSLLFAFDGAGMAAKVHEYRHGRITRKVESRAVRLPGMPLTRAVEERLVRSMPLASGLVPREVVVSGTSVEGVVERKAAAWALDLAARDGAQHHTTRSLCFVGSNSLVHTLLAATPYFQATHIVHGYADLRHLTLNNALAWLELDGATRSTASSSSGSGGGVDTRALTSGRLDALLLMLLCTGCEVTSLPALGGAQFNLMMDAYHNKRASERGERATAAATAALPSAAVPREPSFQVVRELPNGVMEVDLVALLLLFLSKDAAAELLRSAETLTTKEAEKCVHDAPLSVAAHETYTNLMESYLTHLWSTLVLLCYGTTTAEAMQVPFYLTQGDVGTCAVTVHPFATYLRSVIAKGRRYRRVSTACSTTGTSTDAGRGQPAYAPFWSPGQPWTAAEFTLLCQNKLVEMEPLLREYLPGIATHRVPEIARSLLSTERTVDAARGFLQRWYATADADAAHPSLYFSPSLCWLRNEKSRMWSVRYVDLGVQARRADVRHRRSILAEAQVLQQKTEEGAVVFDALAQAWVGQATFPIPHATAAVNTVSDIHESCEEAASAARTSQTLKLLTWNVMFDRYNNQPTPLGMPGIDFCTPQRYPILAKIIDQEDADVVGMQEVEPAFAEYLAAQPWCRERYIMSSSPRGPTLDPWGTLMLVRKGPESWPVQQLIYHNVPAWSGHVSLMPAVTLDLLGSRRQVSARKSQQDPQQAPGLLSVCTMHLLAPFVKAHETARTAQDQALRHCLTRQIHGDCIVMGDFNDWPSNEFSMPAETRYVECWPLVHPGDYGKTMDESNTFCKLKIEETFFGRSDKLFLRTGRPAQGAPPLLKPVEAHLVGTRSVNEENDNTAAPAYLFPSDHYGVSMTFDVLARP